MDVVRGMLTAVFRSTLTPFGERNAMITLIPIGILLGICMLRVFRLTSHQEAIRRIKAQLYARLYEMRLFTDEPLLMWRAQWGLLTSNVRYLGLMLVPAVLMTVPMILIFAQLECFYGYAPLALGQQAVVTLQSKAADGPVPILRAPDGIVVETPPVRVGGGRMSWRIRALRPVAGVLRFVFPGETVEKSIHSGKGPVYISERRVNSGLDLLWHPAETALSASTVNWIEIQYPKATVHALGLDLHWLIWLLFFSMISALVFKRRLGVAF